MDSAAAKSQLSRNLEHKVLTRTAQVGVIGMGYVGLPLALLFNGQRFPITGFDIDQNKVDTLNSGGSYIVRILAEDIQKARSGSFAATSDYARISDMDAILICVPTPLNEYREPDMSYIIGTAQAVAPHLRAGQLVIPNPPPTRVPRKRW
jgi:UDP-N-acetyl-D-glucosamine dehydrogenase